MTDRIPRKNTFNGGFVKFSQDKGRIKYEIYTQILDDDEPILRQDGIFEKDQSFEELVKPFVIQQQFQRIMPITDLGQKDNGKELQKLSEHNLERMRQKHG